MGIPLGSSKVDSNPDRRSQDLPICVTASLRVGMVPGDASRLCIRSQTTMLVPCTSSRDCAQDAMHDWGPRGAVKLELKPVLPPRPGGRRQPVEVCRIALSLPGVSHDILMSCRGGGAMHHLFRLHRGVRPGRRRGNRVASAVADHRCGPPPR